MAFSHMPEVHSTLHDNSDTGVEEYYNKMSKLGEPADDVMLMTAATVLNRRIVVHPIFRDPHPFTQYNPAKNLGPTKPDFYLLYYSDKFFPMKIYKSIIPDTSKRKSLPGDADPKNSTLNGQQSHVPRVFEESLIPMEKSYDDIFNSDKSNNKSPEISDSEKLEIQKKKRRERRRQQRAAQEKETNLSD